MAESKRKWAGMKTEECLFCEKVYRDYAALELHMNQHTKEHPYECTQCPASFTDHRYLSRHRNMVHLKKMYKCDICELSFRESRTLRSHSYKMHSVQKELFKAFWKTQASKVQLN